jgi:hypothetical protein
VAASAMPFNLLPITGNGVLVENTEPLQMLLAQAVSGGLGTRSCLQHMLRFAAFANYVGKSRVAQEYLSMAVDMLQAARVAQPGDNDRQNRQGILARGALPERRRPVAAIRRRRHNATEG